MFAMIHAKDVAALAQLDCDDDSGLPHSEESDLRPPVIE